MADEGHTHTHTHTMGANPKILMLAVDVRREQKLPVQEGRRQRESDPPLSPFSPLALYAYQSLDVLARRPSVHANQAVAAVFGGGRSFALHCAQIECWSSEWARERLITRPVLLHRPPNDINPPRSNKGL